MNWELFGLTAGLITVIGFIPQIIQGLKTKKLDDYSAFLSILMLVGMCMWIAYGIHISSSAVIISNCIGIFLNIVLLVLKFIYSKNKHKT